MNASLHIVILAAGKGTRMYSKLPKVLHQIGGLPLVQHVINTAQSLEPASIQVVIGHGKEQVQARRFKVTFLGWYKTSNWARATR